MSEDDAGGARPVVRRKRGEERLKTLLAAVGSLLEEEETVDIGLYQIARRAGVPPSSIYHFFPTKEAALLALAHQHLEAFVTLARTGPVEQMSRWQDLIRSRIQAATSYYNANPSAMKLFLGSPLSADVRHQDVAGTLSLAAVREAAMEAHFVMPEIANWQEKLAISIAMADGIWTLSYTRHRCITESYVEEGIRAVTAYLRCFLPEHIDPRHP